MNEVKDLYQQLCVQFFNSWHIPGGKDETEVRMENFILLHASPSPAYLY